MLISTLTLYANDVVNDENFINTEDPKNKEKILKANHFTGYKGNVTIEVGRYDTHYGTEGGEKNIGVLYKAYVDTASVNNQKIILYKSAHAPEMKYSILKGIPKIIYNGKDITNAIKTDENYFNTYKLYQYPSTFIYPILNYNEKLLFLLKLT